MSAYDIGNSILLSQYSTDVSDPYVYAGLIFKSNNEVTTRLNDLDTDWTCLNTAIRGQNPIDPTFLLGWNAKFAVWQNFARDTRSHNFGTYLPYLLPGGAGEVLLQDALRTKLQQIDTFRTELVQWDRTFHRLYPNAVLSCPSPLTAEQYEAKKQGGGSPWWVGPILTTFVVGGIVYVGISAYRAVIRAAL